VNCVDALAGAAKPSDIVRASAAIRVRMGVGEKRGPKLGGRAGDLDHPQHESFPIFAMRQYSWNDDNILYLNYLNVRIFAGHDGRIAQFVYPNATGCCVHATTVPLAPSAKSHGPREGIAPSAARITSARTPRDHK
jgi:hypothetical protein